MKRILTLCSLLFIALFSCTKSDSTDSHLPTMYRIDGIHDLTFDPNLYISSDTLNLSVVYVGPLQETVTLSFSDLPAGITVDTTHVATGIPSFYTRIILTSDGTAKAGTYQVKLHCNGTQSGAKYYTFNIIIVPAPSCSGALTGSWTNCYNFCAASPYFDSVSAGAINNRIIFNNFNGKGVSLYADIDCKNSVINIPSQSIAGHTYYGTGGFSGNAISLVFADSSALGYSYCADSLKR